MTLGAGDKYQPHIDGLRAIAVLAVLLFHLEVPGFAGGFVGVDVFLVISGFLITRLLRDEFETTGTISFSRFYGRRIRRLAPALITVLLATSVATTLLASTSMLRRFGEELVAALLCYSNINFWLQADYFDVSARAKPLLHTWSLSVEEQFYLFWPLMVFLALKSRLRGLTLCIVVALAALSLAINFPFSRGVELGSTPLLKAFEDGKPTIFFLLPFRVYEFAIGAALVWLVDRWRPGRLACDLLCALGLCLIGWAVAHFDEKMLFPASAALIPCSGAALLIIAGSGSRIGVLLTNRLAVGIGLVSYSLYLIHWPVIVYWEYCAGSLSVHAKAAISILSLALAIANYRWIEQPFRMRRWPAWTSAPAYATTMMVGLLMAMSDGWSWRLNPRPPFDLEEGAAGFHIKYFGGAGRRTFNEGGCGGPIDVLLMGDSHAEALMGGLETHLRMRRGVNVRAAPCGSFLHLPGFTRTTEGVDWDRQSKLQLDAAIDLIRAQPVPPVVLMCHSWVSQMKRGALLDDAGVRLPNQIEVQGLIAGVRRLRLVSGAQVIILVGQAPGSAVNCAEAMERPALSRAFTAEEIARSPERRSFREFNRKMHDGAKASGDFVFMDPFEVLCSDGYCTNLDDKGFPIYSDQGHLSVWGSDMVIARLSALIVDHVGAVERRRQLIEPIRFPIDPESMAVEGDGLYTALLGSVQPQTHAYPPVQLTENGQCLHPADATDGDIMRGTGGWRYSPAGALRFSSSDGSDPRANGRSYALLIWRPMSTADDTK